MGIDTQFRSFGGREASCSPSGAASLVFTSVGHETALYSHLVTGIWVLAGRVEHYVGAVRDHALSLACLGQGLPAVQSRGYDDLSAKDPGSIRGETAVDVDRHDRVSDGRMARKRSIIALIWSGTSSWQK